MRYLPLMADTLIKPANGNLKTAQPFSKKPL
jgi:hypothetical protein